MKKIKKNKKDKNKRDIVRLKKILKYTQTYLFEKKI